MMKSKINRKSEVNFRIKCLLKHGLRKSGFTLVELLIGSAVMLVVIVGTLQLYMKSNKIAVDQQQYTELQHSIRASMYFISRDIRAAAVGLPDEFRGYALEGLDNESQGTAVDPDRLIVMGNMEDPLALQIESYSGSAANVTLHDYSFELYPYDDAYYEGKVVIVLPNPASTCRSAAIRQITHVTHNPGGNNEKLNFSHGLAKDFNPPGGFSGDCPNSNDYTDGLITFIEVKEFWLDTNGSLSGLSAADGYLGEAGVLYMTQNGLHYPIAQSVENLQFEYRGDFDDDDNLDAFQPWDPNWTNDPDAVRKICQVRIFILGKTATPYLSVSGAPPDGIYHYKRPDVSNSAGELIDDRGDRCRRFILESTSNVRNLSIYMYNTGTR